MPLPKEVPEGLNGRKYAVLAIQYGLILDVANATAAQSRALKCDKEDFLGTPLGTLNNDERSRASLLTDLLHGGFTAGKHISTTVEFVSHEIADGFQKANVAIDQAVEAHPQIREAKDKLGGLWSSAGQLSSLVGKTIGKTIESAVLKNAPAKEIPQGLTAKEYFELGVRYKDMGWTEQSRDALNYAKEVDGSGEIGRKSDLFMRTRLPRHPVPHAAVQRNILGFNYMAAHRTEDARQVFEKLIEDYPSFEWPYSNLGRVYTGMNQTTKARELLWHALDLNPDYTSAWCNLAIAKIIDSEFDDARNCLERAEKLDAENPACAPVKRLLDMIDQFKQGK